MGVLQVDVDVDGVSAAALLQRALMRWSLRFNEITRVFDARLNLKEVTNEPAPATKD